MSKKPRKSPKSSGLQLGRAVEWPDTPRQGQARPRAQSADGHQLRGALHRAGIHLALPGHRPAGFRPSRDRLCAGPVAAGVEIAEALCRELPQSRRLPRGLHGRDRQADRGRDQAEMAAHRRLLVSARRHSDRRVLADRHAARRACGFPIRASRPIAGGDDRATATRSALGRRPPLTCDSCDRCRRASS